MEECKGARVQECKCASDAGDGRQLRSLLPIRLQTSFKVGKAPGVPEAHNPENMSPHTSRFVFGLFDTVFVSESRHACIRDKTSSADVVRLMNDDEIQDACMHNSHSVLEAQRVSLNQCLSTVCFLCLQGMFGYCSVETMLEMSSERIANTSLAHAAFAITPSSVRVK